MLTSPTAAAAAATAASPAVVAGAAAGGGGGERVFVLRLVQDTKDRAGCCKAWWCRASSP